MKVIINKQEMQEAVIAYFKLPVGTEVNLEDLCNPLPDFSKDLCEKHKEYTKELVKEVMNTAEKPVVEKPTVQSKPPVRRRRRNTATAKAETKPVEVKEEVVKEEIKETPKIEPTVIEPVVAVEPVKEEVKVEVQEKPSPFDVPQQKPAMGALASKLFNKSKGLVEVDTAIAEDAESINDIFFTNKETEVEPVKDPEPVVEEKQEEEEEWTHPWLSKPEPKEEVRAMTPEEMRIARENSPFREWHKPEHEPFQFEWFKKKLAQEEAEAKEKAEKEFKPELPNHMPEEWL